MDLNPLKITLVIFHLKTIRQKVNCNEYQEIENLFSLSFEYLNENLKDEGLQKELKQIVANMNIEYIKKSINYIYYNKDKRFINCYNIKIDIEIDGKRIGYYELYLDNDRNFIDEFFIIH